MKEARREGGIKSLNLAIELAINKQVKYGSNLTAFQALSELGKELKNTLKELIEGA